MFVYVVLGVGYILYSFVSLITREFKNSKQVDVLHKLMRIQEEEEAEFNVGFI